jgi:SAM-dependent methyltransferase
MSAQTDPSVNPNQALWEKGDFTRIADVMRDGGEALVATLGVTPGLDVLDLGCGDGTTAVPEAQLGANVLGVDIAENLVAAGNARATEFGLANLRFQWGDATDLKDLADDSFDLVVSIFGAMFAPRPFDVAKEAVRVTRPGGRIVMGNWIPNDPTFVAQLLRISMAYSPPPPEGFVSPMTWGIEENVLERFGAAGIPAENINCVRTPFLFETPKPPPEFLADFRDYYGPTMNAYAAAAADGREAELHSELEALVNQHNTAESGQGTRIEPAYLRVTVMV